SMAHDSAGWPGNVLTILQESGVPVNAQDIEGNTALHVAAGKVRLGFGGVVADSQMSYDAILTGACEHGIQAVATRC
ncbi:MAG: hypothetical protein ACK56I_10855, partial [bacterium]